MTVKNSTKTRRKYAAAFKEDVLKMIVSGRQVVEVAQVLGISASLIHRWNRSARPGMNGSKSQKDTSIPLQGNLSTENERLKAELRRTEQERDILKKAMGIFSRMI